MSDLYDAGIRALQVLDRAGQAIGSRIFITKDGATTFSAKELKTMVDSFEWDDWTSKVEKAIRPGFVSIASEQAERESREHDLDWDKDDPFVQEHFTSYLAERVTQIDETTRDKMHGVLSDALKGSKDLSLQDLAAAIKEAVAGSYAFSASRALTIARTESGTAYNVGALLLYDQNGIEQVDVEDGDEDDDCAEADGAVWDLDEALDNPLAHPNCVRSFSPHIERENGDEQEDDEDLAA